MKKFKCNCGFHTIEIDKKPLKFKEGSYDYIGITIYEHRSLQTGKFYKNPKEQGTVVLIGKEAKKFLNYLKNDKKTK